MSQQQLQAKQKRVNYALITLLIIDVIVALMGWRLWVGNAPLRANKTLVGTAPITPRFRSPDYAIHTSFWWKPEVVWRDLDAVNVMGFNWIKQPVAWHDIANQTVKDAPLDWYRVEHMIVPAVEERGLKIVVRLDRPPLWALAEPVENRPPVNYNDFGDFCGAIATKMRGRIHAYQVWNEPNLDREWGNKTPDPVAYTELLKVCYTQIKAADPQAIVISAALAPTCGPMPIAMPDPQFLRGMYEAGAANYFDVLGLNAPGYNAAPETSPDDVGACRAFAFRHVEDMRRIMLDYGDGAKQIAILEMGWLTNNPGHIQVAQPLSALHPDYNWFAVDPQTQADYLVRAYQYARENWTPWIGIMTTIYMADWDWNPVDHEQWWWSITYPDGTPRPAYNALKEMPK